MKHSPLLLRRAFSFVIILALFAAAAAAFVVPVKAANTVQQATSGPLNSVPGGMPNGGYALGAPPQILSCFLSSGNWVVFWQGTGGGGTTVSQIYYSSSSDGLTWSAGALLGTLANVPVFFAIGCFGTNVQVAYTQAAGDKGTPHFEIWSLTTLASPSVVTSDTLASGTANACTQAIPDVYYDQAGNSYITTSSTGGCGGTNNIYIYKNGAFLSTLANGVSAADQIQLLLGNYWVQSYATNGGTTALKTILGTGGPVVITTTATRYPGTSTAITGGSTGLCPQGNTCIISPAANPSAGNICYAETFNTQTAQTSESTISSSGCSSSYALLNGFYNPSAGFAASNGATNSQGQLLLWMIYGANVNRFFASFDGGATFTNSGFALPVSTCSVESVNPTITVVSGASETVAVCVDNTNKNIYVITFYTGSISATTSSTQTQTVGSCPPGGGTGVGHWTLANNTQYWYEGNALGSEVVNTIQTEVSSVVGSGSHSLQLLIYITAPVNAAQVPSINYPAVLAYSKSFLISSGTVNSTITLQVSIPLNVVNLGQLPFNFWAVGIVGDDHIKIAGSSLSGLMTQTGTASTAAQPLTFTSAGSTISNKLALCATGQYQSVISNTITTTAAASTTTTASTTITSTISTIGPALFSTASNWPTIFLILLLPAGLFLGVTRSLAGAILGLVVGAVIGQMMGILPPFVFIGLVISLVAIAFVARERSQ